MEEKFLTTSYIDLWG